MINKKQQLVNNQVKRYAFPHAGEPESIGEHKDYKTHIKSMNIIDICHQLEMNGYHGRIQELNHFRLALEAILIHTDPKGKYDIRYQEKDEVQ